MSEFTDGVGQAVFVRTDVPDYAEVKQPFRSLEEMVEICTRPQAGLMLERVVVYASREETPVSLTLGYISSSSGKRVPVELGGSEETA
jgi:hypothetical protein